MNKSLESHLTYEELGEIVDLDLEKVNLLGFEECVEEVVDSMIKGIRQGDKFPPVFVTKVNDSTYVLNCKQDPTDDSNRGGHNRAVAHYKTKTPLKCIITSCNPDEKLSRFPVNIRSCKSKSDPNWYELLKKEDKRYR